MAQVRPNCTKRPKSGFERPTVLVVFLPRLAETGGILPGPEVNGHNHRAKHPGKTWKEDGKVVRF